MIDKIMGKRADVSFTKSLAPLKTGGSGAFKKYVTGLGGRGSSKIVTKCGIGEGFKANGDVTPLNFFLYGNYTKFEGTHSGN